MRIFGRMRTSKPAMENSRLGLSRLYTLTNELSQSSVVTDRGSLFFMSQNTARPRFTCIHGNAAYQAEQVHSLAPLQLPPDKQYKVLGCRVCSDQRWKSE